MSTELYKKHRPRALKELLGQDTAVKAIEKLLADGKMPHALLLTGPSGCGKTTIARILKGLLKCGMADYEEVDCAVVDSPLDTVRRIRSTMGLCPLEGRCRIYFLEEVQSLSRAGFSQQALLKLLEDVPAHVYFFLATTDPQKLHKAVLTRCSQIKVKGLDDDAMTELLGRVRDKEKLAVSDDAFYAIIEAAEGSARKALVLLEQVAQLEDEEEQLKAVENFSVNKDAAIDLCRALIHKEGWTKVAKILRSLEDQDSEGIRYAVLGYARACMLGKQGGNPNMKLAARAFIIGDLFSRHTYETKHAGLALASWEALQNT